MNKYFFFLLIAFLFSCKKEDAKPVEPVGSLDTTIKIIQDMVGGTPIVLAGSDGLNLLIAYERTLPDGTVLDFTIPLNGLPNIMEDSEGNKWDIFGTAVEGPRKGAQLASLRSYAGYWFSWATMYPGIKIYGDATLPGEFETRPAAEDWTISTDNVYVGAGADAIPALEDPEFIQYRGRDFLDEDFYIDDKDLVIGVKVGEEYKFYPHPILNWHEIVNDEIGDVSLAITYCPLTGTALAWDRTINGEVTTFGVSGFLYNNNLVPYDRSSESIWSQMLTECVNGELLETKLETYPVVETTWSNWKTIIGEPKVMTENTGYGRDYTRYPYGDYDTDHTYLSFPIDFDDDRLPRKERIYGIVVGDEAKVYRFTSF